MSIEIPGMSADASADIIAQALEDKYGAQMKEDFGAVTLENAWDVCISIAIRALPTTGEPQKLTSQTIVPTRPGREGRSVVK